MRAAAAAGNMAALAELNDQYQRYRVAAEDLRAGAIAAVVAGAGDVTAQLQRAATAAKAATARIKDLSHAVSLVAALLNLATAIVTAVATHSPGGLVTAAQGVVTAASKF